MPVVTAAIITCNEVDHLRDCIASASQLADEVVVCDMESTDGSAELARELGCKVITHPRMPAPDPEARTTVIAAAAGDWILAFDPDMRISAKTARRLREIAQNDEADIVAFYLENHYFGRRCRHGHASGPGFRKFFKKSCFRPADVHIERFMRDSLSGRTLQLGREHPIQHLAYETVAECLDIHIRYARRRAEHAVLQGERASVSRMFLRPMKRFVGNYFLRKGCLDGMCGLVVSMVVSMYLFMIEAHVWSRTRELSQK